MGRLILLLLIVVAAVAINPTLRARALPYVEPVLNPVYEWSTQSRVQEIARVLEGELARGRGLPRGAELQRVIRESSRRGEPVDPWKTPFFLHRGPEGIRVASAGKDRRRGTEDDIHSRIIQRR